MAAIAIHCADPKLRERLERLLRNTPGMTVAGSVGDLPALAHLIGRSRVDAVLTDGIAAERLHEWHAGHPSIPIIALVGDTDGEQALDLLHAGAAAVVPRSAGRDEIAATIAAAVSGLAILPRDVLDTLLAPGSHDAEDLAVDSDAKIVLTPRELEVLAAMADGASNKAIARRLGISFHTAKFHVAAILAKLNADSRTEAVTKAAHLGLVML
jgi:DNA-binding NarL/FixJ family response regulator